LYLKKKKKKKEKKKMNLKKKKGAKKKKKKTADKSMVFKCPEQILSFDSHHTKCKVFNYNSMC